VKGLVPADDSTAGGGPPKLPVKVWTLTPPDAEVASVELALEALDAAEAVAVAVAEEASTVVVNSIAAHDVEADALDAVVAVALLPPAATLPDPDPEVELPDPDTAASISAAVASSTRRFCVKIHPGESVSVSQEFPLPVLSLVEPGAKVPALRAC